MARAECAINGCVLQRNFEKTSLKVGLKEVTQVSHVHYGWYILQIE